MATLPDPAQAPQPLKPPPRGLRSAARALAWASPALTGRLAAHLFFRTPPRRRRDAEEEALLSEATRLTVGVDGDRLSAWRWGRGPVVLLAHGWGGCAGQMTPLVGPLVAAGFSVVAHDAPGHGQSPGRQASIPSFATAIARVAEVVGPLHGVVAHSMGGAAFSLAAARGLGAERAVYLGPPSDAAVWVDGFVGWLALPPATLPALRAEVEAIAGEPISRLNSSWLGPRLRTPLLVIHDRKDREVPWAEGERVAREATAGRLVVTEGLGHRRIVKAPEVAVEAVRFIAQGR